DKPEAAGDPPRQHHGLKRVPEDAEDDDHPGDHGDGSHGLPLKRPRWVLMSIERTPGAGPEIPLRAGRAVWGGGARPPPPRGPGNACADRPAAPDWAATRWVIG